MLKQRFCQGFLAAVGMSLALDATAIVHHDGDFDLSYGVFGKALEKYPGNLSVYTGWYVSPIVLPGGELLIAASRFTTSTNADFGVIRLNATGTLDTTFGTNGAAVYAFNRVNSTKMDIVSGMVVQSDGKIVVNGTIDGDTTTGTDFGVVRFKSGGTLDTTFGNSGRAIVQFNLGNCPTVASGCDDHSNNISVQSDDKLLSVGQAYSSQTTATQTSALALVRLTAGGIRDTTFGTAGRVTLTFANGDQAVGYQARQLADGQHILAVGGANLVAKGTNDDFALAKLDSLGHLDTSFGNGGKATYGFDIGGDLGDIALDFVELPDGRLFVCGEAQVNNPSNFDFACMQFLANGQPDPNFAPIVIPFDIGDTYQDAALVVKRDSQGRLLLAGFARRAANNFDMALARLLPSGALDTSFGNGGVKTISSNTILGGSDFDNQALGLAFQPDEKIIVAGTETYDAAGDSQFEVARLYGDTIFSDDFDTH